MNYCYIPDKNYKTCVKIPNINAPVPGKYCFPQTKDSVALNNCKNGIDNDNKYDEKCTFSDPKYTKEILSHECGIANGAENYCGNKPEQQQCRTEFTGHCAAWNFCCVGNFDKSKCELDRDSNLITKLKDANGNIQCIKDYYGCRWDCSTSPPKKVPVGKKPPPGFIGCYETMPHCQSKI